MKKRICALLAVLMVVSLMSGMLGTPAQAALAPAPIQQTYVVDGVTYFDAGSNNFAIDSMKFYKDLLSTRTSLLAYEYKVHNYPDDDVPEVATYDQCIGDLWLRLGARAMGAAEGVRHHQELRVLQREHRGAAGARHGARRI